MEFIVCIILASILTGGRIGVDLFSAAKGNPAPHVEKARIRAEQQRERLAAKTARLEAKNQPRPADGKPQLRDVVAVYWGDAMADAIDAHNRRRAEKQAQRVENARATAANQTPAAVRPSVKDRIVRLGRLLWEPVGETAPPGHTYSEEPASTSRPAPDHEPEVPPVASQPSTPVAPVDTISEGEPMADVPENFSHWEKASSKGAPDDLWMAVDTNGRRWWRAKDDTRWTYAPPDFMSKQVFREHCTAGDKEINMTDTSTGIATSAGPAPSARTGGSPTGEVANYETAMVELDAIEEAQRNHLEQAQAALSKLQGARQDISNTQATYRPAAEAAGNTHQSLAALNLDAETIANTGTMADAMPPNDVDVMFDQLEAMEARVAQQVVNAEAALAATEAARQVLLAKYGEAHAIVQGELAGDSRFLAGAGGVRA